MSDKLTAAKQQARPIRIQRRRVKGWRKPENTVIVDRTSKWGNPHKPVKKYGFWCVYSIPDKAFAISTAFATKQEALTKCVEMHRKACLVYKRNFPGFFDELKGKNLACTCPVDQPCHSDVLLRLANPELYDTSN